MDGQRLLARFLQYVQIDTMAQDGASGYPSSPGQLELGRLLVEQLRDIGLADARQDAFGVVLATVPASTAQAAETIAFCAHLDTSPETSGAGVKPQVLENYRGGDIVLPGDASKVIRVADNPELGAMIGHTLVTTDGTTLLGADDKAGLAVIMETAARLMEDRRLPCGPVRLCFTCDEEIGRGVDHLTPDQVGAVACYTLDGQGADTIDVETFSADLAVVKVRGVNIHPSIAQGRMVNAVRAAADFLARLPQRELAPEWTAGRDGFLHPYQIHGGVGEVEVRILLRDFEAARLADYAQQLQGWAEQTRAQFPGLTIEVEIVRQYRNMAEGLAREPRAVAYAERALRRLGRTAQQTIVRGGTDGSRLTELGLPTPNLATGEHAIHSPLEWTSLEEMEQAVAWLLSICQEWTVRE
jgi:tripeptide aminopeptidase